MIDGFPDGVIGKRMRFEILRAELELDRASFEPHWRELSEHFMPRRARFTTSDTNRGEKRSQKIIDTTPIYAARTLRAGMMSGITSPARPWFRLMTPDPALSEFGPVKQWLDDVRSLMSARFLRSNLYQALPTLYGDMGVFATGAMLIEEDDETTIRCTPFPIGEYYLANDARLQVRTFMRKFRLTVRQVVQKFGRRGPDGRIADWSNVSTRVKNLWDNNQRGTWVDVVHVIIENLEHDPRRLESKFKRYADCYYEIGGAASLAGGDAGGEGYGSILAERGYDDFPVLAGRWELAAGDVYGTDCPGMTALGDNKQLQFGEKKAAQILDKIDRPPMVAPTVMRSQKLTQLPGDVTYMDETTDKKFRPAYDVSQFRFDYLEQKQQAVRSRIDRAFYVDLFLLMAQSDRRDITATEIIERKEEKLLALGPMLEQVNQDVLDPLIDRTFGIMVRRGEIPPPPKELQGEELRVDYVSIMAQAQKALGRSGLQGFMSFVGEVAQVKQDPSVFDKVDTDQAIDEAGEAFGVPTRIIVGDEQVAAIRKARADAQRQQQQAALAEQAAGAAKDLSQTDTSGKNALTDLLSSGVAAGVGQ